MTLDKVVILTPAGHGLNVSISPSISLLSQPSPENLLMTTIAVSENLVAFFRITEGTVGSLVIPGTQPFLYCLSSSSL